MSQVNGLDGLLAEKNLLRTGKIEIELTNCGLGIDASVYLRQVYSRQSIKESLSSAIGGIPAALTREVEDDLAMFKKQKVNLLFVFDGLDLYNFNHKDDRTWRNEDLVSKRKVAWDAWTRLSEKGISADVRGREELVHHAREAFERGMFIYLCKTNGSHFPFAECGSLFNGHFGKTQHRIRCRSSLCKGSSKPLFYLSYNSSHGTAMFLKRTTSTLRIVIPISYSTQLIVSLLAWILLREHSIGSSRTTFVSISNQVWVPRRTSPRHSWMYVFSQVAFTIVLYSRDSLDQETVWVQCSPSNVPSIFFVPTAVLSMSFGNFPRTQQSILIDLRKQRRF
jgi:hypothetical protein